MKKEEPEIDIYKSLKKNNLITLSVIITSCIISCVAIYSVVVSYKNNNRFVYGLSKDNSLMPLELIEKKNIENILVKGHIEYFLTNFYQYDQWNYIEKIEKSLWLIDNSGKELYFFYKDNGHFNALIQTNSSQNIKNISINISDDSTFIVESVIEVNKQGQIESNVYKLITQGKILKVSQNYPKNPYGYLITNFKEVSKTKL